MDIYIVIPGGKRLITGVRFTKANRRISCAGHRGGPPTRGICALREVKTIHVEKTSFEHGPMHRYKDALKVKQRRFALLNQQALLAQCSSAILEKRLGK